MNKNALFIGRFQPFHLGHLSVIQKAIKENDHLFIGIGSTKENFQIENPFTIGERFQMIFEALKEAKISREKYSIIPIPNINNYALWPKHVANYLPPFQIIYTGSKIVKSLFENENSLRKSPYKIIFIKKELNIFATKIRESILKNGKWEIYIPKSTGKLIKKFGGIERIKDIQ